MSASEAPRDDAPPRNGRLPSPDGAEATLPHLDDETRTLVRLAAIVSAADEVAIRAAMEQAAASVRPLWVEELILQSYLFAGFPRALNAAREWRRASERRPSEVETDEGEGVDGDWRARGEATCRAVYGPAYDRLRHNIRALHPALDAWMIVEGYGKVLGRPGLDLARRELCIIAACVATSQSRQLHAHLHGALNVGASRHAVTNTLAALDGVVPRASLSSAEMLWARVRGK